MIYKKIIFIILVVMAVFLLSIAAFNYKIDPANIFRSSIYEEGIAEILVSKKNVAGLTNYDERLVQKYVIKKIDQKRDIIVLGSSRVRHIDSSLYPGKNIFNHGVGGASMEDIIAIYELYKEKNLIPKKIIIGLDPWILNRNNDRESWMSLEREYDRASKRLNFPDTKRQPMLVDEASCVRKYLELISMPYTCKSYSIFRHNKIKSEYYPATQKKLPVGGVFFDGSIGYPEKYRNAPLEEINKKANDYRATNSCYLYLKNFSKIDKKYAMKFEKFIGDLEKEKVEVEFFFSPYHPAVYRVYRKNSEYFMVLEVERYFINFAKNHKIRVLGSYDPKKYNLSEFDFYDGMHAKDSAIKKIFNRRR